MSIVEVRLSWDYLRQKEERYRTAIAQYDGPLNHAVVEKKVAWAKDEVDRAFALFVEDLKQYVMQP